jgi:hypothetical protein
MSEAPKLSYDVINPTLCANDFVWLVNLFIFLERIQHSGIKTHFQGNIGGEISDDVSTLPSLICRLFRHLYDKGCEILSVPNAETVGPGLALVDRDLSGRATHKQVVRLPATPPNLQTKVFPNPRKPHYDH